MAKMTMDVLRVHQIVAIVRGIPAAQCEALAGALRQGGIRMIEVTFDQNSTDNFQATTTAIRRIIETFPDMYVGAGTVLTTEQVRLAHDSGAQYIIAPDVCPEVIRETKRLDMLSFPGAMTPTEIAEAYRLGADAVKVFPAGNLGPGYLKAVRAPLKHIPLLAVGGINEQNIKDYLRSGAIGAGVGGNLVNARWIEEGAFDRVADLAARFVAACREGESK